MSSENPELPLHVTGYVSQHFSSAEEGDRIMEAAHRDAAALGWSCPRTGCPLTFLHSHVTSVMDGVCRYISTGDGTVAITYGEHIIAGEAPGIAEYERIKERVTPGKWSGVAMRDEPRCTEADNDGGDDE